MLLHLAFRLVTVVRQIGGWVGEQAGRQTKIQFLVILYLTTCKCFFVLSVLHLMLDGLILFHKSDFCHIRCL